MINDTCIVCSHLLWRSVCVLPGRCLVGTFSVSAQPLSVRSDPLRSGLPSHGGTPHRTTDRRQNERTKETTNTEERYVCMGDAPIAVMTVRALQDGIERAEESSVQVLPAARAIRHQPYDTHSYTASTKMKVEYTCVRIRMAQDLACYTSLHCHFDSILDHISLWPTVRLPPCRPPISFVCSICSSLVA